MPRSRHLRIVETKLDELWEEREGQAAIDIEVCAVRRARPLEKILGGWYGMNTSLKRFHVSDTHTHSLILRNQGTQKEWIS